MTKPLYLDAEQIARVCHEANRAYCMSIGDHSQGTWDTAPQWQKDSAINGAQAVIENPDRKPRDSHEAWYAEKEAQGWKHGPKNAPDLKEHPCMVPYEQLSEEQQVKDYLFVAVAMVLSVHTVEQKPPMEQLAIPHHTEDPPLAVAPEELDSTYSLSGDDVPPSDEVEASPKKRKRRSKKAKDDTGE